MRKGQTRQGHDDERGATLVEAALAYGLLFLTLFAVVEFGLAFKDWLSVSNASRDGARAGATFGTDANADIQILREVESTLAPIGLVENDTVRVFRANNPGPNFSTTYQYDPGTGCESTTSPMLPGCCDWTPCPEVGRVAYVKPTWEPECRKITPTTDRIGVEIEFTHEWLTGFFASSTDFTTATDFQIEPQLFEAAIVPCT